MKTEQKGKLSLIRMIKYLAARENVLIQMEAQSKVSAAPNKYLYMTVHLWKYAGDNEKQISII